MAKYRDRAIHENTQGPKRATDDSGSMQQHDLTDQIEADRYLNSKEAVKFMFPNSHRQE